jgi:hypothetical protein
VPGQSATGPVDGIPDVGTAFYVPEAWRRGNQFNGRVDYELRPGKDRLYGNTYRTTSYTVNGSIRPAFNVPVLETTHVANVNHTHLFQATKLNELRVGMMRLVGTPDTPSHLNLADPETNLNNNNFGRSTSQLAPRALQIGLAPAILRGWVNPSIVGRCLRRCHKGHQGHQGKTHTGQNLCTLGVPLWCVSALSLGAIKQEWHEVQDA